MASPEYGQQNPDAHSERLRKEAKSARRMANFANGLGRRTAGKVADMVAYYTDEAANRAADRGILVAPDRGIFTQEFAAMDLRPDIGQKLLYAVDGLHRVLRDTEPGHAEYIPLTTHDFQTYIMPQPPTEGRGFVSRRIVLPPHDELITNLLTDIHALTGLDRNKWQAETDVYIYDTADERSHAPLGVALREWRNGNIVNVEATSPRNLRFQAQSDVFPESPNE